MAQQLSWVPGGMAVDLQTHTAAVKLQRASAEHSGHPHNQSQKWANLLKSFTVCYICYILKWYLLLRWVVPIKETY